MSTKTAHVTIALDHEGNPRFTAHLEPDDRTKAQANPLTVSGADDDDIRSKAEARMAEVYARAPDKLRVVRPPKAKRKPTKGSDEETE